MDIVAIHQVMPDEGITMLIQLDDTGVAVVNLDGETSMPCWCGDSHRHKVSAQMRCDSRMGKVDMDDMDAAIRGEQQAARRLGWRLMHRLFFVETPPCERLAANHG